MKKEALHRRELFHKQNEGNSRNAFGKKSLWVSDRQLLIYSKIGFQVNFINDLLDGNVQL